MLEREVKVPLLTANGATPPDKDLHGRLRWHKLLQVWVPQNPAYEWALYDTYWLGRLRLRLEEPLRTPSDDDSTPLGEEDEDPNPLAVFDPEPAEWESSCCNCPREIWVPISTAAAGDAITCGACNRPFGPCPEED